MDENSNKTLLHDNILMQEVSSIKIIDEWVLFITTIYHN